MDNILIPEKNKGLLKLYHSSSKALIPLVLGYYVSNKYESKSLETLFYTANVLNMTYHSYVSASCIITDYIKPVRLSKGVRSLSMCLHGFAFYGYFKKYI